MADLVQQARAALEGVTPGPWTCFIDDSGGQWSGWPLSVDSLACDDKTVVRPGGMWPYVWGAATSQIEACSNARFIAASRDLVPAMADEIERLRDRIAELEATMDAMRWQPIETAPTHTKKSVLVRSPEGVQIAWWSDRFGGWLTDEGKDVWDTPTHWAHLPPDARAALGEDQP